MNHHPLKNIIKNILLLNGFLIVLMILGACTGAKSSSVPEFKKQYFEGKSDNWSVKIETQTDSYRHYTISYIGEGNQPLKFKYDIKAFSYNPNSGDGELKNDNKFEIDETCSGACDDLPNSIPIQIQWEGKKEEFVIRKK